MHKVQNMLGFMDISCQKSVFPRDNVPASPGKITAWGGLSCFGPTKAENLKTFFQVLRKPATDPDESPGFNNASSLENYFQSLARAARELFTIKIKFHQCRETLKIKKQESDPHFDGSESSS